MVGTVIQQLSDYYRYCPGEEHIKISDAMCLGRRRSNFHKCAGCPFNDDEKAAAASAPAGGEASAQALERHQREDVEAVLKAYDIRGLYPDPLSPDVAWRIGLATAQFLRSELRGYDRTQEEMATIVVGRDMRRSSPELTGALIEGLRCGGAPVVDLGLIDTPQLYFAVNHLTCCGGVQVTASHNRAAYNGFKICGQKGKPVSLETGLNKIGKIAMNTARSAAPQLAPLRQAELTEPYQAFVRGFLRGPNGASRAERPLRVVVDASNGMAGRWFPLLFGDVDWLEVIRLNFDHNGEFVHDPNPLIEANLAQLKDRVIRSKADLGVCFDGDADRCVFVDDEARTVPADLVTALLARHLLKDEPGASVVYDLRSSRVVAEEIRKAGGVPRRHRCGDPYIKKCLADGKGIFAGERSGHYYFRSNFCCDSAMIAFAEMLNLLNESGQCLRELVGPLRRYCASGERNFEHDDPARVLKDLADRFGDGQVDELDGITVQYEDWWFNVRGSNTEPCLRLNVEANDEATLRAKLAELVPLLGRPLND